MHNIHNYSVCVCSDDDWKRRRMRWRRGGMVESKTAKERKEKEWRSKREEKGIKEEKRRKG